mgnify:CR=1 FL=1
MSAAHIIQTLAAAGIDLDLSADGKLTAPAGSLSDEMRQAIKAHRSEIIDQLTRATTQSNDPPPVSPHAARVAELAGAAYLHHFACKHCKAAGRGLSFAYMRCDTGRKLWEAYQDAIE